MKNIVSKFNKAALAELSCLPALPLRPTFMARTALLPSTPSTAFRPLSRPGPAVVWSGISLLTLLVGAGMGVARPPTPALAGVL